MKCIQGIANLDTNVIYMHVCNHLICRPDLILGKARIGGFVRVVQHVN